MSQRQRRSGGSPERNISAWRNPDSGQEGGVSTSGGVHPKIKRGDRGMPVQNLQQQLSDLGYAVGAIDGIWGRQTDVAVRAFQEERGLRPDGIAGNATWTALTSSERPGDSYLAEQYGRSSGQADRAPSREAVEREPVWAQQGSGTMEHAPFNVDTGAYKKAGLREDVLKKALDGYDIAWKRGQTRSSVFTVVDYELKSTVRRLFTLDLATGALLHSEFMAHGENSGDHFNADEFSNDSGSHQSSLGMMKTAETYHGKFGYAMRLDGMERGINDAVRRRTIVMHGQHGVEDGDDSNGRSATQTWGCLGLDPNVAGEVIDTIKNGTMIFSYYPDPEYAKKSGYVKRS